LAAQYRGFVEEKKDPVRRTKKPVAQLNEIQGNNATESTAPVKVVSEAPLAKTAYVSVSVPKTRVQGLVLDDDGNPIDEKFTEYGVLVKVTGMGMQDKSKKSSSESVIKWWVWHRYSTFRELHTNLQDRIELDNGFPSFPPQWWIKSGMDEASVSARRLDLQRYLQCLLPEKKLLSNTLVRSFLGMNQSEHYIEPERKVEYVEEALDQPMRNDSPQAPTNKTFVFPCVGGRSGKTAKCCIQ